MMRVTETGMSGLLLITPDVFEDSRGYFIESYQLERYSDSGVPFQFIQDNESKSSYGVVRGLHYQLEPHAQTKLVRVVVGKVYDVVVDLRKGSPTFGQWSGFELDDKNKHQLLVPKGFAHGFSVLSESVVLSYKCDNLYSRQSERGIRLNDPTLNIDWKVPVDKMIVSEKDKNASLFAEAETNFIF